MKKTFSILAATLFLVLTAQAQNRFDATIFGGLNFSQIDGDDAAGYMNWGLRGGVGTSFALGDDLNSPWRMVLEVAFTQKGSQLETGSLQRLINLNYVEIPIMMSYNMLGNRLRLSAGVAPAILTGAQVTDNGNHNNAQEARYLRFDWLPVTVGVRYLFTYNLAIEARYQTSLLNIYDNPSSGTYRLWRENMGLFNRTVSICLSYSFFNQ